MKGILLGMLLVVSACASTPASVPELKANTVIPVMETQADGSSLLIGEIDTKTFAVKLVNGGTQERVLHVVLAAVQTQSQSYQKQYQDLADLCIGRGKSVKPEAKNSKKAGKS